MGSELIISLGMQEVHTLAVGCFYFRQTCECYMYLRSHTSQTVVDRSKCVRVIVGGLMGSVELATC